MACRTSLEVEHLLAQFRMNQQDTPLVTPRCISLDNDWNSKEEVMKGMTDNLCSPGDAAIRASWKPIYGHAKPYFPPGWVLDSPFHTANQNTLSNPLSASHA